MRKRLLIIIVAIILVIIVTVTVIFNYPELLILYVKYFDPHSINVFFFKEKTLIGNLSISLFAFYPTPNGTVMKQIYQGYNLRYLSIPLSNLTEYAEYWIKHYNYTIIPSLIGFASYYVNNTNGTITIYSQPFTISISPYNVTHGIGKTEIREFVSPIKKVIRSDQIRNNVQKNLAGITPQQVTTTSNTVPSMIIVPYPGMAIEFLLDQVWYTPQNTMLPIAVAYVTDPDYTHYLGFLHVKASASTINGYEIKFGITLLEGAAHYEVFGTSITTSSATFGTLSQAYLGKNYGANSDFAMIYTLGQIAIANFSEWIVGEIAVYVGEVTMTFLTQLWINGTNGAYVPAMWTTNWPYISPTDYFQNEKLNYSGISIAPYSSNGYALTSILVSTSYGTLSGGIPLEVVLKFLEYVLHVSIPSWVSYITFVADPEVSITTFTTSSTIVTSYVGLTDLTYSYKYYIYYSQTSSMYRIGENYFYIPFFYFYINYTIG